MARLFLLLAILSEILATSSLKASQGFTRPFWVTLVVAGYGSAFYCLSLALRQIPVGVAYAIWSGAGIVLISLIGYFFFHEKLDLSALAGMLLILLGVLVIQVWSKSTAHS
jgi:small multidrug resistance pump